VAPVSETVSVRYDDSGLRRLADKAPDIFLEEMTAGVLESSLLASREVQERTPTSGAGTLRNSIGALPVTISGFSVSAGVGTALSYAAPVELGSKPHWAPIEPLVDWVERKLGKSGKEAEGIARAIQYKIAHEGTEGAFMFRDGFAHVTPQVLEILAARVVRGSARAEAVI
jgi:hypothetical protein